jgi:hypothetical protein
LLKAACTALKVASANGEPVLDDGLELFMRLIGDLERGLKQVTLFNLSSNEPENTWSSLITA